MIDFKALAAPFPPDVVSWRVGPKSNDVTKPLAYIDARDVMNRLDEVCGPENWQNRYSHADAQRVVCEIGIRVGDEWVWKADGADDTDIEATKGSLSDALKRAAVRWGIGRYLYDIKVPFWVKLESNGKAILPSELPRLYALLPSPDGKPVTVDPATAGPRDIEMPSDLLFMPGYDNYRKVKDGKSYWKITEVKADGRAVAEALEGITDSDELVGFRQDNAVTIEAMRLALPEWHKRFEERFNQKGRELAEADALKAKQFHPDRFLAG